MFLKLIPLKLYEIKPSIERLENFKIFEMGYYF